MRFDITDLRLFVAACRCGTITGGAARVGIALASASQRIAGMEADAGERLLARGRDGVRPTAAGDVLLGHAVAIVERWEAMSRQLGLRGGRTGGRVRLAVNTAALATVVPSVLPDFLIAHPAIAVDPVELPSEGVTAAVLDGTADLGIALAPTVDAGLDTWPLAPDPLALVLPRGHPLARRRRVPLAAAVGLPFVALPAMNPLQRYIDRHAVAAGIAVAVRARLADLDALCRMVEQGAGAAVLPAAAVRAGRRAVAAPLLADAWADRRLVLCRPRNRVQPAGVHLLADHLLARATAAGRTE